MEHKSKAKISKLPRQKLIFWITFDGFLSLRTLMLQNMLSILCPQEVLHSLTLYCKFEVMKLTIKLLNIGNYWAIFEFFWVTHSATLQLRPLFCTLQSLVV